ncbi:MAG: LamG-like jellyroll fold domain-containing protein [Planctomycetota bacterium]|jgi:hypothetical protein
MCSKKLLCLVRFGLLIGVAFNAAGAVAEEYFPSFADGNTVGLWLFDESDYPHTTITDASWSEKADLCLMDGGAMVEGRFGRALEITGGDYAVSYAGFAGKVPEEELREEDGEPSGLWGPTEGSGPLLNGLAGSTWTVELWLNLSSLGTNVSIVDLGWAYDPGFSLTLNSGSFELVDNYGGVQATCPTVLSTGAWHHVAFTRDGGTVRHFVDGAEQAAASVSSISVQPIPDLQVPLDREHESRGFENMSYEERRQNRFNFAVGTDRYASRPISGKVDEMRMSRIVRYTSNFAPASFSRNYGSGALPPSVADGPAPLFNPGPMSIPLEIGGSKHVFIDDAIIDTMSGLQITMNRPYGKQAITKDFAIEKSAWRPSVFDVNGAVYMAIPEGYSGNTGTTYLATSEDGVDFSMQGPIIVDAPLYGSFFRDLNPNTRAEELYKVNAFVGNRAMYMYVSPDGVNWRRNETIQLPLRSGGEGECFWDDQRGRYAGYIKRDSSFDDPECEDASGRVAVGFWTDEILKAWPFYHMVTPYFEGYPFPSVTCEGPVEFTATGAGQVYRTRAIKYPWAPDVYLAFLWRYPGDDGPRHVDLGISRNGEDWNFFGTNWYIPLGSEEEELSMYGLIRRGDEIWQYVDEGGAHGGDAPRYYYRYRQRLDGFVSLDAGGTTGTATTLPMVIEGRELALNVSAAGGWVKVGLLDEYGTALAGCDVNDCDTIGANSVEHIVSWQGNSYVAAYSGMVVRLQIEMQNAKLYAFQFGRFSEGVADNPNPADGAEDVAPDVEISWSAGVDAAEHNVYLGTDFEQVSEANLAVWKGALPVEANSYDPCGLLELGTTYYWRIDEVNDGNQVRGDVWSFTTAEYIVVDDMESYDDVNNPIYETWVDGCGDANGVGGNGTGSCIEVALGPVHGGGRSMRYSYDNNNPIPPVDGNLSEIERTYPEGQDWTVLGVKALTLYFYGDANNDAEPMYAFIGDDSNEAVVIYGGEDGEDVNDVTAAQWHEWNIDLQDFNDGGVDLREVVAVGIGFGDRINRDTGGSGTVYLDDIRLYPRRCLVALAPAGDVTGDCRVNREDVGVMAGDWLDGDEYILRMTPDWAHFRGWYRLDESSDVNVFDSSGNNYDGWIYQDYGTPEPDWRPGEGRFHGCLRFDGQYGVQLLEEDTVAPHLFSDVNEAVTITFWLNGEASSGEAVVLQAVRSGSVDVEVIGIYVDGSDGSIRCVTGSGESDGMGIDGPADWVGNWNHYALVKDAGAGLQAIYRNGCLAAKRMDAFSSMGDVEACSVGKASAGTGETYVGKMDDVRVYSYAMPHESVVYTTGERELYCPLASPANLYDEEPMLFKKVNFKDFCVLAGDWLEERFWP